MPTPKALTAHGLASALAVDASRQRESSAVVNALDREPYRGSDIRNLSSSDRLGWLQQQYYDLMHTLLREVSAPTYEIAEESRSRIKADIVSTQTREIKALSQVDYLGSPSFELPSLANPRNMQMQFPITTGSRMRECSALKADMDRVSAPVQHVSTQHSNPYWCTSPPGANASAMDISSIAPSSNTLNETQPATQFQPPAHLQYAAQSQLPAQAYRTTQVQRAAQSQFHAPQAPAWTSENDDVRLQSYIPQPEASPRFPQSVLHPRTVPPAQITSSRLGSDSEALISRPTLELHSTQPGSEGGVIPWQQRGRDDGRSSYDGSQVAKVSSRRHGDSSGGVTYRLRKLDSAARTSNISFSEESSSHQMRKRRSKRHSLHLESAPGELVPQWGNDPSDARSSKRSRISRNAASAVPAQANENPPAFQSGASEVTDVANYCQDSRTGILTPNGRLSLRARQNWTPHREGSLERAFEDDGREDWAEHIVDKLLATWTTLPHHASQTNFGHGNVAEAAC